MNRLDLIEKRKNQIKTNLQERQGKLEKFKEEANNILLNEDTKDFFKLAFELYGQDVIDGLRKATKLSDEERNNLIGKFDLLHQIIIPFLHNYK